MWVYKSVEKASDPFIRAVSFLDRLQQVDNYGNVDFATRNERSNDFYKNVLFWLTLQEDINYPAVERKEGRRLNICRYIEAICLALNEKQKFIYDWDITIKEVQARCENKDSNKPELYTALENLPNDSPLARKFGRINSYRYLFLNNHCLIIMLSTGKEYILKK